MLPVIPICVGLLALFLARYFLNIQRARQKLPAGPMPLPIIGNLGMLGFRLHHETLLKMASIYGDIYTLWLGQNPVVVLNGFKVTKEVLINNSEDFAERPLMPFQEDRPGTHGLIFLNGHVWKQWRRFTDMALRKLGMGKMEQEHYIHQEARRLVEVFTEEKGRPVDPYSHILLSICNVIGGLLFGHGFSTEDQNFHRLIKGSQALAMFMGSFWARLYEALPGLMKSFQPLVSRSLKGLGHQKDLESIVKEEMEFHKKTWSPEEPRDFTDCCLAQLEKSKDDPSSVFTESHMVSTITDLFVAGLDSSVISFYWTLLYMTMYPEIQEQVQKELDTVLGPSHVICYEDRKILPFTHAVLHETHRKSSSSALGVLRRSTKDTFIHGFLIHKGTVVIPNLFSLHHDPEEWETPRKFNPNHFLDKDGNFVNKDAFLPFSAGARVCVGKKLAGATLFILFASLLQAFTFRLPEGVQEINCEPVLGIILQPHPYKICIIPRQTAQIK